MSDTTSSNISLSNSYVYGINWDGSILLQGQLTARMAWQMMLTAKRVKKNKAIGSGYKQRAIDGFQLLKAYSDDPSLNPDCSPEAMEKLEDKILRTWISCAASSKEFERVKSASFNEGVHFIVIFHHDHKGEVVVNNYIVSNREFISGQKIKLCAQTYFHQLASLDPTLVPTPFLEENPFYIR